MMRGLLWWWRNWRLRRVTHTVGRLQYMCEQGVTDSDDSYRLRRLPRVKAALEFELNAMAPGRQSLLGAPDE